MRKTNSILFLILIISIIACLIHESKKPVKSEKYKMELEKEDGILQAQEQDFKNTKDLSLGYVPQYRLINATENMVKQRRALRTMRITSTGLNWTERGPNTDVTGPSNGNVRGNSGSPATSGRIRAVWVDLTDPSHKTVWIGGASGGIWKTTDITASPANWAPVNDFLGNLAVGSICQDPSNTDIMYFGTGEKTFNVDAVRGGGIWKSTDHGLTWNLLGNTTGFYNVSRIICDGAGNIYVGTIGNNAGLIRSTDGGATWVNISPSGLSVRIAELKLINGRVHVVCGYFNSSAAFSGYRYTDNPATVTSSTWTSPVTSFPQAFNSEIAGTGNTLYALNSNVNFETPVIYKSTDKGVNWSATATSPPVVGDFSDLSSGQGWYCLAAGVDPADPDKVIVGGLNTYRSVDGGDTWSLAAAWVGSSFPYVHADLHTVAWNGDQVLIASDGGLFYSPDDGVSYSDRNTGLRLKQFYSGAIHPSQADYFIAGAQDNGVHQLNNPGLGGSIEVIGGDGAICHIDRDQPQYQFGAYTFNHYQRSTDGGASWTSIDFSDEGQFINPTDYDDLDNKLYAAGNEGQYIRWENPQTGNTFTRVNIAALGGTMVSQVMVSPYTQKRIFLGTDLGRIVRVDQADLNYPSAVNIRAAGMPQSTVSCIAAGTDDDHLIATFSNYGSAHIWMTTTGGSSGWTNISGNLPDIPVRWAMFYPYDNNRAIIATEAGIYQTNNINGSSTVWIQDPNFPIVRTNMLQYRPSDGTLLAATHGRGLWTATMPLPGTYVQFGSTAIANLEAGNVATGCNGYRDYTVYLTVSKAPSGTATATLNNISGTATRGVDYDFTTNGNFSFSSNEITFPDGSSAPQPVTIRIYDDANTEGPESFTLNYTLSGTTDAVPAPSSQSFSFTIQDNDLAPRLVGATRDYRVGAYFNNLTGESPFRSSQSKHRLQVLYRASELIASGITAGNISALTLMVSKKNSTKPFKNFTVSMGQTSAGDLSAGFTAVPMTQVYTADYSSVVNENTLSFGTGPGSSSEFAWDGTSNMVIQYCFDSSPNAPDPADDFMEGGSQQFLNNLSLFSNGGTGSGCSLPPYYISNFRINVVFTMNDPKNGVETALNATGTNALNSGNDVYYYNGNGKIMARITNLNAFNFGCSQVILDRAGTGASPFLSTAPSTFLTSKTWRVIPTTNNPAGEYQITLYYTAAEKAGWEAATGNAWSNIKIVKVKSSIGNYSPSNTSPDGPNAIEIADPVFGMYGSDYTLTATFSSGFSGFAAGVSGMFPLPVTLVDFGGKLAENRIVLEWSTSSEQNARNFIIEKSINGRDYYRIGSVQAVGNSSNTNHYHFNDPEVSSSNYYRLRMYDQDDKTKLSGVVLIKVDGVRQKLGVVNNPFAGNLDIRFTRPVSRARLQLVSSGGSVITEKVLINPGSQVAWPLPSSLGKGTYILRAYIDGQTFTEKVIKQ